MKTFQQLFTLLLIAIIAISCKKNSQQNNACPGFDLVPSSPYQDPALHPSGNIIGFNHTPLKEIKYTYGYDCPRQAAYIYNPDSTGFWLVNADGTNKRRILPYKLQNPAWSPDGKWIAFVQGAQIFKMPFDGQKFDEAAKIQLTNSGRNFFPAWSPDGESIAYNESICSSLKACGIWAYNLRKNSELFIAQYGNYPSWLNNNEIVFVTTSVGGKGNLLGDSLWSYSLLNNNKYPIKFLSNSNSRNSLIKVSYNYQKIAFISQSNITNEGMQLFIMDINGSNLRKLTTDGTTGFSWSPDGRIVYVRFDFTRIDESRGVLWTMNSDGSNKKQLTYNQFKITQ